MRHSGPPPVRTALVAASVLAWGVLAWMAVDMAHPLVQLTMPGGARWSPANLAAIYTMWAVMMAAMMLPSALPVVQAFVRLSLVQGDGGRAFAFVAAYLLTWAAFSAVATAAPGRAAVKAARSMRDAASTGKDREFPGHCVFGGCSHSATHRRQDAARAARRASGPLIGARHPDQSEMARDLAADLLHDGRIRCGCIVDVDGERSRVTAERHDERVDAHVSKFLGAGDHLVGLLAQPDE